MPLVVGVDAGGSRTTAAAQRDGRPPNVAASGPANASVIGIAAAAVEIARAIDAACGGDAPAAIAVGAAGARRAEIARALGDALRERFLHVAIAVVDDARIALRAAIPAGDGAVLIAGTGSVAYAEVGNEIRRAGGGGYAIGDEGSGYAIGAAAFRLLLRALEGRAPRDPLLDALASYAGAATVEELIGFVYDAATIARIAGAAEIVLRFADAGERSATRIVQQAAVELFDLVRAVCREASGELPLAFAGGLLGRNSLLSYLIESRIAGDLPHLRVVKDGAPPYTGAIALALQLANQR